jgi:hypothetical protein
MSAITLSQTPFNTTFMSMMDGVFNFNGYRYSPGWVFGASGTGFIVNIHKELCPSGPYVWDFKPVFRLIKNMGIEVTELGFYSETTETDVKNDLFDTITQKLDKKVICGLLNDEFQIIHGYKDNKLFVKKPWQENPYGIETLTFPSWDEISLDIHVSFFCFDRREPIKSNDMIYDSLQFALNYGKSGKTIDGYTSGLHAYDTWIHAIEQGYGKDSQGNWWNGLIYHEGKKYIAEYFDKIAGIRPELVRWTDELNGLYSTIAQDLKIVANRSTEDTKRIKLLTEIKANEELALDYIERMLIEL